MVAQQRHLLLAGPIGLQGWRCQQGHLFSFSFILDWFQGDSLVFRQLCPLYGTPLGIQPSCLQSTSGAAVGASNRSRDSELVSEQVHLGKFHVWQMLTLPQGPSFHRQHWHAGDR